MTPERLQQLKSASYTTTIERELFVAIEHLQKELAAANEHEVALEADVEKGDETETRLRGQLEQAKDYLGRLLLAHYPQIELLDNLLGICTQIDNGLAVALSEAKERERRLQDYGYQMDALAEVRLIHCTELKSANARLREALTRIHNDARSHPDNAWMIEIRLEAEAALTVPPAPVDEKEAWLDGRASVKPVPPKEQG